MLMTWVLVFYMAGQPTWIGPFENSQSCWVMQKLVETDISRCVQVEYKEDTK